MRVIFGGIYGHVVWSLTIGPLGQDIKVYIAILVRLECSFSFVVENDDFNAKSSTVFYRKIYAEMLENVIKIDFHHSIHSHV